MKPLKSLNRADNQPQIYYWGLSGNLGFLTLAVFGTERFLFETSGQSLGDLPAYVLGGIVLIVGVSAFSASINGQDINTAVLLSAGPVGGLLLYLIGYHLVLPPSTDSPTWLIFLAFAGGILGIGTVAHLCGRIAQEVL